MKKIVLASASPRRKELLEKINLKFEIIPSTAPEVCIEGEKFSIALIEKVALAKVMDVSEHVDCGIIIGADTVVVLGDEILEKPKDEQDAFYILRKLSGETHKVVTSIVVYEKEIDKLLIRSIETFVTFKKLTDEEILNYIKTKEPMDKAGAYGAQGLGTVFIEKIEGCFNNVVGISTYALSEMLKEFEVTVL